MLSLSGSPLSAIPGSMCDEKIMQLQERVQRPRALQFAAQRRTFWPDPRASIKTRAVF